MKETEEETWSRIILEESADHFDLNTPYILAKSFHIERQKIESQQVSGIDTQLYASACVAEKEKRLVKAITERSALMVENLELAKRIKELESTQQVTDEEIANHLKMAIAFADTPYYSLAFELCEWMRSKQQSKAEYQSYGVIHNGYHWASIDVLKGETFSQGFEPVKVFIKRKNEPQKG